VEDGAVFAAMSRVIARHGPRGLTLARIGAECGLSPAALVQRFGSKRCLLRAMSRAARGGADSFVRGIRERESSPLALAREFVLCFAELAGTPQAMANNTLAYVELDLSDPVLRRGTRAMVLENEAALSSLIEAAVAARELGPCDAAAVARALLGLASGSLLGWALHREGAARDWLARDVDTVLGPLRTHAGARS
jgi:AcrR family transcriptional regulator